MSALSFVPSHPIHRNRRLGVPPLPWECALFNARGVIRVDYPWRHAQNYCSGVVRRGDENIHLGAFWVLAGAAPRR